MAEQTSRSMILRQWLVASIVCGLIAMAGVIPARAATTWTIDEELNLHLAFVEDPEPVFLPGEAAAIAPVRVGPEAAPHAPDIANINLAGITGLGFTLPRRRHADRYRLYLKFFEYPRQLDVRTSVGHATRHLQFARLANGAAIERFAADRGNVLVKKGHVAGHRQEFTPDRPYPPLLLPGGALKPRPHWDRARQAPGRPGGTPETPQRYFDTRVAFSSLYLRPVGREPARMTPDQRARFSAGGVVAFHAELLALYRRTLPEMRGPEPDRWFYFAAASGTPGELVVLRLPRRPMIFSRNWRDLPMPQDPARVFLSGLLLIFRDIYTYNPAKPLPACIIGDATFRRAFTRIDSHVFEIGSVVRQPR